MVNGDVIDACRDVLPEETVSEGRFSNDRENYAENRRVKKSGGHKGGKECCKVHKTGDMNGKMVEAYIICRVL